MLQIQMIDISWSRRRHFSAYISFNNLPQFEEDSVLLVSVWSGRAVWMLTAVAGISSRVG